MQEPAEGVAVTPAVGAEARVGAVPGEEAVVVLEAAARLRLLGTQSEQLAAVQTPAGVPVPQ